MQKIGDCPFADDVLFDVERGVWARMSGGLVTVGIDTIQAWISGPFTAVTFKELGAVVDRWKSLGSVEGPRHFDVVRSPLSGRVVAVNGSLLADPGLLNHDPYGEGWFAKLAPLKLEDEKGGLLSLGAARPALERKIGELKVRCFADFPDYEMFEIGSECAGILVKLDELISRSPIGAVVHLVSDDPTAEVELVAWGERTGQEVLESRKEGNLYHFIIKKTH